MSNEVENDLQEISSEWLVQCGPCDHGLVEYPCNCPKRDYRPVIMDLVNEVERLRGELVARVAHAVDVGYAKAITDLRELAEASDTTEPRVWTDRGVYREGAEALEDLATRSEETP